MTFFQQNNDKFVANVILLYMYWAKIKNMSGSGNPTYPIFLPPTLNFFLDFCYEIFWERKV
jgi:hypothetical protein